MLFRGFLSRFIIGFVAAWISFGSLQANVPFEFSARGCARALQAMVKMISIPSLKRPAFLVSQKTNAPSALGEPHFIYFETKYVKQLRDKAHLSPSQVDRFIQIIKQSIFQEIIDAGINPIGVSNDYKSIRLELEHIDPILIQQVSERATKSLHLAIEHEFLHLGVKGKSIRKILDEIPGYKAPFSIGVGRNLNEAGIAARIGYIPNAPIREFYSFTDQTDLLYKHFLNAREYHQSLIEMMLSSLNQADFEKLTTKWGPSIILKPEVNDLLRKSSDPNELALQMQRRFRLESMSSPQLLQKMIDFYNSIRVFEPPLAYTNFFEMNPDELSFQQLSQAPDIGNASDFMVSIDIRRVGAFHASALQSAIANPEVNNQGQFEKLIESISYGESQRRYENLMLQADSIMSSSLKHSETVASKSSGDEVVRYFKGPYSTQSISRLLRFMTPDMRATMIPMERFRSKGSNLSDDQVNEMRHVAETLAKSIHEELGDEFGSSLADDFRFLVELEPSKRRINEFEVVVHFQATKSEQSPLIELALHRIKNSLRDLLISKGLPAESIARISSIKTRTHRAKSADQLPPK